MATLFANSIDSPNFTQKSQKIGSINIQVNPGCHGPHSPVIGTRSQELARLYERIERDPLLGQFENALYYGEHSVSFNYLNPLNQKDRVDEITRAIFLSYIDKYTVRDRNITESTIIDWCLVTNSPGECSIVEEHSRRNWLGWHVHAKARRRSDTVYQQGDKYLPPYLCAYHEIQHVEDAAALAPKLFDIGNRRSRSGTELRQTLKTLILGDAVFKEVHQIGVDSQVDHGKSISLQGHEISIGVVANFYRKLEEGHNSLCDALLSSQSTEFLQKGKI